MLDASCKTSDVLELRFGSQLAAAARAASAARTAAKKQVFRKLRECVVDSDDLPLDISHEALRKSEILRANTKIFVEK